MLLYSLSTCLRVNSNKLSFVKPSICTFVLSFLISSAKRLTNSFLFFSSFISIKSITIIPPISLSLICFAISIAASLLIENAVSSSVFFSINFAELTSIAVKASVLSIVINHPLLSHTFLFSETDNCFSILFAIIASSASTITSKSSLSKKLNFSSINSLVSSLLT